MSEFKELQYPEKYENPCKDCLKAEWLEMYGEMYGEMYFGCDMGYCIADLDDYERYI